MCCCYLLKKALQAGFTNVLLLSTEDSNAGRVYKWVTAIYWRKHYMQGLQMCCCYLLKKALQAWYAYGLLLSNADSIAGRV